MSTLGDQTINATTEAGGSDTEDSRMTALERKYTFLLTSTAKLLQRTAKRQKSNKDLERTVKYMRALYNQVRPQEHGKVVEEADEAEEETPAKADAEIQALMNKTVFMVEEDREYQRKKHLIRDNAIGKAKMDMWARWQK